MAIEAIGSAMMSLGFLGVFAFMAVMNAQSLDGGVKPWAIAMILICAFIALLGSFVAFIPQVFQNGKARKKKKR